MIAQHDENHLEHHQSEKRSLNWIELEVKISTDIRCNSISRFSSISLKLWIDISIVNCISKASRACFLTPYLQLPTPYFLLITPYSLFFILEHSTPLKTTQLELDSEAAPSCFLIISPD